MNIVVYCGASEGNLEIYKESTINLGKWIAKNNHTLVYGGGNVGLMGLMGLMGLLADTVLQNNGDVIGVIPEFLIQRELSHQQNYISLIPCLRERPK